MITTSLRDNTYKLLKNRNIQITLEKISNDTSLSVSWLEMFSRNGGIKDPSVNKVQTLYEYLTGSKLELR